MKSLNPIGGLPATNPATPEQAALRKAAQQFEAIFLQQMLKTMRSGSEGGLNDSEASETFTDLHDQALSDQMAKRGIGLADLLVKQLSGQAGIPREQPALGLSTPVAVNQRPAPESAPNDFITRMAPLARAAGAALGVDPRLIMAHAALESGWGKHQPQSAHGASHNLFGIKARAGQPHAVAATLEHRDGAFRPERAAFRAYPDLASAVNDYVAVLSQPRYATVRNAGADAQRFARGLADGGYATDPAYAEKLMAVARDPRLAVPDVSV